MPRLTQNVYHASRRTRRSLKFEAVWAWTQILGTIGLLVGVFVWAVLYLSTGTPITLEEAQRKYGDTGWRLVKSKNGLSLHKPGLFNPF